jgi:lipopolysaccharide export system permease protein
MHADLVSLLIHEGRFATIEKGLVFHVERRETGGVLSGILISDERKAGESVIFYARKGYVSRQGNYDYMILSDGEIQQSKAADNETTIIKFDSYVLDLSSFSPKISVGSIGPHERTTPELLDPSPDDPYYKQNPNTYRAQIHERFSEMLWPFTYVIVMLAFAGQARSSRESYGSAIGAAMLFVTVLRCMGFFAVGTLKGDGGSVLLVYALPLVGIVFGSWFVFNNKPVELPPGIRKRVDAVGIAITRRSGSATQRFSPGS